MKLRQIALVLHRYIGVTVGILLAIVSLTGSSLIFWKEINVFLNPQMFQVVPQGDRVSVQFVVDTVRSAYPDWQLNFMELPRTLNSVYTVQMLLNNGGRAFIYLDPYTGSVLGSQEWGRTLMSFIYEHPHQPSGRQSRRDGCWYLRTAVAAAECNWTHFVAWLEKAGGRLCDPVAFLASLINYDIHKVGGFYRVYF
jgi:hypothetical protein